MPINRECAERLTTAQLVEILGLESFKERDKLFIRNALLTKNGVPLNLFRELHGECTLQIICTGSSPSGFFSTIDFVQVPQFHLRSECQEHGVRSREYRDLSLPDDVVFEEHK